MLIYRVPISQLRIPFVRKVDQPVLDSSRVVLELIRSRNPSDLADTSNLVLFLQWLQIVLGHQLVLKQLNQLHGFFCHHNKPFTCRRTDIVTKEPAGIYCWYPLAKPTFANH